MLDYRRVDQFDIVTFLHLLPRKNNLEGLTRFVAIFHARQGLTVNFPWRFQGSLTVVGASVVVLVRLHYSSITGIDITCDRCRHHWHHYKLVHALHFGFIM